MKRIHLLLLITALLGSIAYAHQDRYLTVRPDGVISEVPASFGLVSLKISGLGGSAPKVRFRSGKYRNDLPACVTRFIRTRQLKDVLVTGSWYHDESVIPYYIYVQFYEPGYVSTRNYNSSFNILFNLQNAQVIKLEQFIANVSGDGGQYRGIELPKNCEFLGRAD